MQIVTLTTDWGYRDQYIGQVKAMLYSTIDNVNVVDISHSIEQYNLSETAFVVKNACMNFPEGTIHIIDVDSYEDINNAFIAVKCDKQYFICTDNGVPSIVFRDKEVEIVEINLFSESNFYTFAALDLFVKVAKNIAESHTLQHVGIAKEDFVKKIPQIYPIITEDYISVEVIHIDKYGNAFLNITDEEFCRIRNGRKFSIRIGKDINITRLSQSYSDVGSKDEALLTVSSIGYLQFAVREGNAARLRNLKVGSNIRIDLA